MISAFPLGMFCDNSDSTNRYFPSTVNVKTLQVFYGQVHDGRLQAHRLLTLAWSMIQGEARFPGGTPLSRALAMQESIVALPRGAMTQATPKQFRAWLGIVDGRLTGKENVSHARGVFLRLGKRCLVAIGGRVEDHNVGVIAGTQVTENDQPSKRLLITGGHGVENGIKHRRARGRCQEYRTRAKTWGRGARRCNNGLSCLLACDLLD